MNCFLHGIEDFQIVRGDTLSEPKLVEGDRLMSFDVVLANPPYSIKQWDRDAFASDPWGRNLYGTPPQGRADYAFWQHILQSLNPKTGRCAILFPHGVLFRQEEAEMRRKLIEADLVECVLGLGPNLFYNASMEACVVICRAVKPKGHKGRTLFINAVNEVTREHAQSFLTQEHIEHVTTAYRSFKDESGFAKVATLEELRRNAHSLKVDLYVTTPTASNGNSGAVEQANDLQGAFQTWRESQTAVKKVLRRVIRDLEIDEPEARSSKFAEIAELRSTLGRKNWTRVRFGDVVNFVKDSVDPASGELDRYIAGEHMETENVHIRKWGIVGDGYLGPAFIRKFRKGQVLYGSRRTYLKKVAFAEFDGITANTTFVLEGVEGKLHQALLPWIMLSQRFTEHSIRESKGSTNPYINFPDIAKFEFDLPPLEQQKRIAEMLWSFDRAIESESTLAFECRCAGDALRDEHFENSDHENTLSIKETGKWISGGTPSRSRTDYWNGSFPWVSPKDMKRRYIADSEEHLSEAARLVTTEVPSNSLLIVIRGMILAHSFPVAITERVVAFNQDMKALIPDDTFSPTYLYHWFRWVTPRILGRISESSHGTKRLAREDLFELQIPRLSRLEQDSLVEQFENLELAETRASSSADALKSVQMSVLNEIQR